MIFRSPMSVFAAAMLLAAQPAFAQTSDSATVDALATLVTADQPLTLTGVAPLNFGQITIPDNLDSICAYDIASDGRRSVGQSGQNFGEGPSPGKCAFTSMTSERAQFNLRCADGQSISLSVSSASLTPSGSPVFFETFENYLEADGTFIYAWDQRCADQDIVLRIGGVLFVRGTAQPGDGNVQVGSITIEAFYQ